MLLVDAPEGLHRLTSGQFYLLGAARVRVDKVADVVDAVFVRDPGLALLAVPLADFFPCKHGVLLAECGAAGDDCCGANGSSAQGGEEHGLTLAMRPISCSGACDAVLSCVRVPDALVLSALRLSKRPAPLSLVCYSPLGLAGFQQLELAPRIAGPGFGDWCGASLKYYCRVARRRFAVVGASFAQKQTFGCQRSHRSSKRRRRRIGASIAYWFRTTCLRLDANRRGSSASWRAKPSAASQP